MQNRILQLITVIVVGVVILGTLLVPTINKVTQETISVTNTGAGELRYVYNAEPVDYSSTIIYTDVSDEITTGFGGADLQTITAVESVLWASDIGAVIFNGSTFYLMADDGETAVNTDLGDGFTVTVSEGVVTISDSEDTVYSGEMTWSYAPQKNGVFGFFTDTGKTVKDFPVAAAGSFAGAYAYNSINSLGLSTFAPTYSVTDGVFTTGPWTVPDLGAKTVKTIMEEKEVKEIEKIEKIEKIEEKTIKAVPTPTYTDGDWGFNLSGTNAIIVSYSGAAGDLSIPATVTTGGNSYPVTTIGLGSAGSPVFDNSTITGSTVTIPNSVTAINDYAFVSCSGFTGDLVIPDSVTSIGKNGFSNCSGFTSLTLSDSLTSLGERAFSNCNFTGDLVIPDSVTSIGASAFDGTHVSGTLTLSDSLTSLGERAFANCNFTGDLVIPDSLTSISKQAFNTCSGVTGLTLSDSLTSIGEGAFYNCPALTGSLIIPDSVTSMGTYAFYNCGFTSLALSDSLTSISNNAFDDCDGLTGSLIIPDSVTSINNRAFRNCTGLTGIVILGSPTLGTSPFTNMAADILNLGNTAIEAGQYGLAADAVIDDEIASLGYIAPVSFSETVQKEGAAYDLMKIIPVIIILAVLVMAATAVIKRD